MRSGFIDFLKEFADKCHHGKEEGLLFPALTKTGMAEAHREIEMLYKEHEKGRILIGDMSSAIVPVLNAKQFVESAESYAALLIQHITKENATLFPMVERILTADQLERLFEQFEEHESNVIGPGRHEELHAMLKSWKVKYA